MVFHHFPRCKLGYDLRMNVLPPLLLKALQNAKIDINSLDDGLKRQFAGMIKEAQNPDIRQQRLDDIINLLLRKKGGNHD